MLICVVICALSYNIPIDKSCLAKITPTFLSKGPNLGSVSFSTWIYHKKEKKRKTRKSEKENSVCLIVL